VVITTHYMDEAEYLCDRVAIIDLGRIIALDKPERLIDELVSSGFERHKEVKKPIWKMYFCTLPVRNYAKIKSISSCRNRN